MSKILLVLVFVCLSFSSASAAPITKTLAEDTLLHPQGDVSGSVKFKGGTSVTLNEQYEVISGTLKYYGFLIPASKGFFYFYDKDLHSTLMIFKPDTCPIVFNARGEVLSGQIGEDASFLIWGSASHATFKKNTYIEFDEQGYVKTGTIYSDITFRPLGWRNFLPLDDNAGFILFKGETEVFFGPGGQVSRGTIAKEFKINKITYPAGTTLQFSESSDPQIVK
ncbi:hypothetical protein [Anaeroselena agilis]|uniref:Uncharacterized protein n=1 Tax=Anaeroselena agilis TaxID=3063788 RepID=A0ABU3NWM9_9FIRM|nr:hypothetical protein [Selenomonadales bacterium 4137-cl]